MPALRTLKSLAAAITTAAALATAAPAHAGDDWTSAQRDKGMALAGLVALNWAQEHSRVRSTDAAPTIGGHIPRQPNQAYIASYSGQAIGNARQPHESGDIARVNRQYLLGAVVGALILDALPGDYRDAALDAGLVLELGVVANNLRLGVGFRF